MGSVRFKNQLNSAPLLAKPLTSGDKFGPDYVGSRGKQPPNRLSWRMTTNNVLTDVIAEFGRKYLWWEPVSGQPHSEDRIIAQTMNLGTYDDILLLEEAVGKARLLDVMLRAGPGWMNVARQCRHGVSLIVQRAAIQVSPRSSRADSNG